MILLSILWYFNDTSCKGIRKVSFLYIITYQIFTSESRQKDDTMTLFFIKKLFSCTYKLDEKSKKYLIWNLIDTLKITSQRRLYHMATQSFLRHDTEIPASPCNFKGIGRDYTDSYKNRFSQYRKSQRCLEIHLTDS